MSAKKKNNTKTDWQQVAQSMHDRSGTLCEKLKSIWNLAHRMVKFVDENHPNPIKKVLKRYKAMFTTSSPGRITLNYKENKLKDIAYDVNAHYVTLHHLDMDYDDSLIAESYFGVLGMLGRIETSTNFVALYSHECRKRRVSTIEFIEKNLCSDTQVFHSLINEIVPLFFSLQLHCHNLIEVANSAPGVPADPRKRKKRSAAGGKKKNYGEEVLKGMISNFLNDQNPKSKYKNVNALFQKLEDGLEKTLNDYLDLLGSPTEAGGDPLSYGMKPDLTINGITRKLHQWKNKDPEFKKQLEKICILR